jgi:hypothetical protein
MVWIQEKEGIEKGKGSKWDVTCDAMGASRDPGLRIIFAFGLG